MAKRKLSAVRLSVDVYIDEEVDETVLVEMARYLRCAAAEYAFGIYPPDHFMRSVKSAEARVTHVLNRSKGRWTRRETYERSLR